MVRKSKPEPRYIRPEHVQEGDTVRVTITHLDVTRISVGTVKRIRRNEGGMTLWYSKAGVILLSYYEIGIHTARVTLVDHTIRDPDIPLEGL